MATIIGSSGGIYASTINGCWARAVNIPVGWNKLRVGVRARLADYGAFPEGTPRFGLGLCSGTTNILGDATTTHFLGATTNTATWTRYTAGAAPVYYNFYYVPHKKVNTTDTYGTAFVGASDCRLPMMYGGSTVRYVHYVEISKGSPNYTLAVFTMVSNNPNTDYTEAQFLEVLQQTTCVLAPYTNSSTQAIACNEAVDGTFSAVNFWWDKGFAFEVHDIGIAIVS